MEQEFNGKIHSGSEYDEMFIGEDHLASEVMNGFDEKIVKLRYYISNSPIDPDTVVEEMLRTFYEGLTEANGCYMMGTTWTGCYGRHDELEIGGHNIIAEIQEHVGKYCYLIIETKG